MHASGGQNMSPIIAQTPDLHDEDDYSKGLYGSIAADKLHELNKFFKSKEVKVADITPEMDSTTLRVRARLKSKRIKGSRGFLILRQGEDTLQVVVAVEPNVTSKQMLKFCGSIPNESVVDIEGIATKSKFTINSCTIIDTEIKLRKIYAISLAERLPFDYEDACRSETNFEEDPEAVRVNLDTRLESRYVDLRTPTNRAIFKIQSEVCHLFREYMRSLNFVEIHTPKLLSTPSEGGASVFEVSYFKRHAYLAQSPQFYKQIMVCSDFDRVFEIGPVFRAENSQTHRHLTEFTGLDMEMAFTDHYTEVLDIIENLFVYIFDNLKKKFSKEINTVKEHFNLTEFTYLPKTLRMKYSEGIKLLQDDGVEIGPLDDINVENEKRLGSLIKKKYNTDFYTLNKFPLHIRPFYTMHDPDNKELSNSYDIYMRGEEVLSGGQRIHDTNMLIESIKKLGISTESMKNYVNAFRYGVPPHAGGGIGLERVVMLYLGIGNIRYTTLFPRDPKRLDP